MGALARWQRSRAQSVTARSAARTHVGRVRTVNEDRLLDRSDRLLWAVADGMGGHSAGDVAADRAIAVLATLADDPAPITPGRITAALERVNAAILADAPVAGSGTTIVAVLLDGATVTILWAGDSRAYLIRGAAADRLTRDHSVVQELVDAGLLADADAHRHPRSNVITRALGVAPTVTIDTVRVAVEPGDLLLLCSDGVSRSLGDRDFLAAGSLDERADRLLANALQRDGSDNASLLLVAIDG